MLLTEIDHATCHPQAHRTAADTSGGEDADATGRMQCAHCGRPLAFCAMAALANATSDGYERKYFHPNPADEETCR